MLNDFIYRCIHFDICSYKMESIARIKSSTPIETLYPKADVLTTIGVISFSYGYTSWFYQCQYLLHHQFSPEFLDRAFPDIQDTQLSGIARRTNFQLLSRIRTTGIILHWQWFHHLWDLEEQHSDQPVTVT